MSATLYWHDYETFGTDPARDRIAQFAGLRTDESLQVIGEPTVIYCQPTNDYLPQPASCLITGITPQHAHEAGVSEAHFAARVHAELAQPGTCSVGYNSMRFDEEFTRHLLYRNFYEPYAREWQNGNSRWDLIDVLRLARALRPEGLEWPQREDGTPGFRLEDLAAANGVQHEQAHDALSDVRATLALARLLRERQPRLYEYVYRHRDKRSAARLLGAGPWPGEPVLHVSGRYPADLGCIAPVSPLARHPQNANQVIVYDLRADPRALLALSAEQIRERLFVPGEELPDDVERPALKSVHLNRAPVIVPASTLSERASARWRIDLRRCQTHLRQIRDAGDGLCATLAEVFAREQVPEAEPDVELALYSGGFLDDADRALLVRVRESEDPERLRALARRFTDPRMPELLFRYRARNFPQTLDAAEAARWEALRRRRLQGNGTASLPAYRAQIEALRAAGGQQPRDLAVLDALEQYAASVLG